MHIQIIDKLGDAPFTLFTHDWGSHVGLLYQNKYPKNVESMVVCDVLVTNQDQLLIHPYKAFLILYYTINFAFAYVLSQLFRMFGQVWYMGTLAMLMSFPFISTTPCENFRQVRDLAELGVHMTYPYYYMWRGILTGTIRRAALPSCPMLYMVRFNTEYIIHYFNLKLLMILVGS
jgi:pimeloyl-ACP methyl ester carboxylesterase